MEDLSEEKEAGTAGTKALGLELPAWEPQRKPAWLGLMGKGRGHDLEMEKHLGNPAHIGHVGQVKGFGFDSKGHWEFTGKTESIPGRGTASCKGPQRAGWWDTVAQGEGRQES